jgi:hypothetical protein
MSPTDIHIIYAATAHSVRLGRRDVAPPKDFTVTVTVTRRRPAAAAHAFSSPIVREIPPAARRRPCLDRRGSARGRMRNLHLAAYDLEALLLLGVEMKARRHSRARRELEVDRQ